jgi:hypothetical protein
MDDERVLAACIPSQRNPSGLGFALRRWWVEGRAAPLRPVRN